MPKRLMVTVAGLMLLTTLLVPFTAWAAPYIVSTDPPHGATDVPLNKTITIVFSEPMDTVVTSVSINPTFLSSEAWNSPTNTILIIDPVDLFAECTTYVVEVISPSLIPGPVPNPWSFTTECVPPIIVASSPTDMEIGVALDASIIVTFSEPMDTATVTWSLLPTVALSDSWNGARTILTLSHTELFTPCTLYKYNITGGKDDQGLDLVPGPVPNPQMFLTACSGPYIVSTDPSDGEIVTDLFKPIIVTFSEPMNISTVTFTLAPVMFFTESWDMTETVLTLSHAASFVECKMYTAAITNGQDKSGRNLVPGPVPNPWSFIIGCPWPFIVTTSPADGEKDVSITADIVVTFSEPMNISTVMWSFTGPTLTPTWNSPINTILTLIHIKLFLICTNYTMEITAGKDLDGFDLIPGPVPNPWTFWTPTTCPSPRNLILRPVPFDSILLDWEDMGCAREYHVYESQEASAAFPSDWNLIGVPTTSEFVVPGHLTDGLNHFYIVRAYNSLGEGSNSTMGVKPSSSYTHSPTTSNIQWFSLPYNSTYTRASDIAGELTSSKIDVVGKWDPALQRAMVYYYARGRWRGTDFTINPGDGLYLSILQSFPWNITGTDANVTLSFTLNPPPMKNVNWVGIPYTGIYSKASDISSELTSSLITEVGLWNPATQTSLRWYWNGTAWTGMDFTISPGAGVYIVIIAGFTWPPKFITPVVP